MPVIANATIQVTPVLEGAQKTLTEQLTGAGEQAGDVAGKKTGGVFSKAMKGGLAAAGATAAAVGGVSAALISATGATAEYGDQIDVVRTPLENEMSTEYLHRTG